ncbi:hypothetical protein [Amycolatopsis sp.]|uniref:hypothetical protein n=1 Tax=Amycolatopsis sp. TaxID=37632 RepID=UPI002BC4F935|nr:hypothetical protein [Amycolatopsis sp.]HVV14002.1 hypothetical protein [Amycolatopsis sp.]
MFLVYCPACDSRTLMGIDEVEWVHNLAPGMISVTGRCPRGHEATVLTGESFTPRSDPRRHRTPRRRRKWWAQLFDRHLPEVFYRF